MEKLRDTVRRHFDEAVRELKDYCRLQTVSAQGRDIDATVEKVVKMVGAAGGRSQVLDDLGGNPVIYAEFEPGPNGNGDKTLLFYNHYDVQPAEPVDEWSTPPFEPTERDGKLYARGVADNKGDLVARLTAIRALQDLDGGLPCRVKFLIEGEEEIGSPNLTPYLAKYADLFAADACIWEFGGKDEAERVSMVAGIKGMAYLQLWCHGADVDMHSSVGAYVDNAAWRLVQALATMRDADNNILVEGFRDGIIEPTEQEREIARQLPFSADAVREVYGLKRPLITDALEMDPREAALFEPTMTICGLESGYTGEGAKTVLPKKAQAKVDCRLVPGQDPDAVVQRVREHLDRHGFTDVHVDSVNGQKAYRSDLSNPFVDLVVSSAREAYGSEVVLWPNSPGTGPMYDFGHHLGNLPIVSTGVGWFHSRAHAPDESIRLADFEQGIMHMALLLRQFGNKP